MIKQIKHVLSVDCSVDDLIQLGLDCRIISIADRFHEKITQWIAFKQTTKNVIDLAAKSLPFSLQLFQQAGVNGSFSCLMGNEIPAVTDFRLTDSMNAPEPLLKPIRVPRQVVVNHQMGSLKVDTFPCGIVGYENFEGLVLIECLDHVAAKFAFHSAMDDGDGLALA